MENIKTLSHRIFDNTLLFVYSLSSFVNFTRNIRGKILKMSFSKRGLVTRKPMIKILYRKVVFREMALRGTKLFFKCKILKSFDEQFPRKEKKLLHRGNASFLSASRKQDFYQKSARVTFVPLWYTTKLMQK